MGNLTDSVGTVSLQGGTQFYLAYVARNANITLRASAEYFGAVCGKTVTAASQNVKFHFDKALKNLDVPGYVPPGGGSGGAVFLIKSQWQ